MKNIIRGVRYFLYLPVEFFPKILPAGPFVTGLARFIVRVDRPLRAYLLRGRHEI